MCFNCQIDSFKFPLAKFLFLNVNIKRNKSKYPIRIHASPGIQLEFIQFPEASDFTKISSLEPLFNHLINN